MYWRTVKYIAEVTYLVVAELWHECTRARRRKKAKNNVGILPRKLKRRETKGG